MAHNVNIYVGRQSAWHALGTVTGTYMTWAELCTQGLNFTVEKQPLFDKNSVAVAAWGTFRTDTGAFLGAVGESYTVLPHAKGFEMVDALVASVDGAHYETAGALGKGEVIWGLADLNLPLRVGDDVSKNYLLFWTSYDASAAHSYGLTSVRVVCQNTLRMALSGKSAQLLKVRHTKSGAQRLKEAHLALQTLSTDIKTVEEKLTFLAQRTMTRDATVTILDRLFPKTEREDGRTESSTRRENVLADILSLYESNDRNTFPEQRGTAYNMLNAVTNYVDHSRTARGGETGRFESALFGHGNRLKGQALEVLLEEAQDLPEKPAVVRSIPSSSLLDQVVANTPN